MKKIIGLFLMVALACYAASNAPPGQSAAGIEIKSSATSHITSAPRMFASGPDLAAFELTTAPSCDIGMCSLNRTSPIGGGIGIHTGTLICAIGGNSYIPAYHIRV